MEQQPDSELERSQEPEQQEQEQELVQQDDEPVTKARKPRKRKAKAMEAHLFGLSADERAAILASIESPGPATRVSHDNSFAAAEDEEPEPPKKEPTQPPEVIEARQKVLRTSWRMAAFSHFSATFPHLVAKDFDIDKLEADLNGTDENSYIGEVVSRLLYTLTRDSRLAGKEPDKPWLFSLRREYLKYDPAHNPLGDWPLYAEEEYPAEASTTVSTPQDSAQGVVTDATLPGASQAQQATAPVQKVGQGPLSAVQPSHVAAQPGESDAMDVDQKEGAVERVRTSKGWEDLTLEQKIYSLWSICEWQLTNPEKFKTFLTKPLPEEHQVVWRIDPIGTDSKHNVYWLFDDNRLWVERESPQKRELRLIYEEAQQKNLKKQAAREKRLLANQRKRMKALHEARRLRIEAKRIQEEKERKELEAIHAKIKAEGGTIPVQASPNGKKRKRAGSQSGDGSDDEDFEVEGGGGRTSSRLGKARLHERMAARPPRRKSTRTASSTDLANGNPDDEDWQKIPADWLKTEDQERNEDPDFGEDAAENEEDFAADDAGSDSGLSNLDEDDDLVKAAESRANARTVSRRSPRKTNDSPVKAEPEESELSPLSGGEDEDFEVSEDEEPEEESGQTYPDSKYNMGPSFEDEDKDLPEGFVKWESLCTNLEEWEAFPARFAGSKNANELALLDYINVTVIPGVRAAYEVIAEERRRKEEAERAYLMRQRKEAERKAAKEAAKEAAKAAKAAGVSAPTSKALRGVRSTRSKASTATPTEGSLGVQQDSRATSEVSDTRASGLDRRAARAQQREEEKRAREEAELMAALQASQPPPAPEKPAEAVLVNEGEPSDEPAEKAPVGDDADYMPGAADEVLYNENGEPMVPIIYGDEEEDYFLDCSICKKRGINLDADLKLVQCDTCDRWEHIACHREADKKAGRPRRNFDVEDFHCEDCEGIGHQAIKVIPKANKRERTAAQKVGAAKGAEKRKAKMEEKRQERAAIEAATGKKPPARKRNVAQPLEKEIYKPVARTTKRSRQSGVSELGNDTTQMQDITMQDEADASVMEQDQSALQLNGSSSAVNSARPPVSHGSDIPIDPNLASRVSSPLPQASAEQGSAQSAVPLPSFLQTEEPTQALPALSSKMADVPIPGLAQPSTASAQGDENMLDPLLMSNPSNGLQQ